MIEDELLAEQLVDSADHEQRVGRIVGVDDVESLSDGDVEAEQQAAAVK